MGLMLFFHLPCNLRKSAATSIRDAHESRRLLADGAEDMLLRKDRVAVNNRAT
jgi:hypothetical protein